MEKQILQDSPSFVDLCTLHQHAMRYYRLWIYACNTVLALATLIFSVFAISVLVDPRISLLSGVELYQPTFLYAYVALLLQCGVLQAIGCIGALRLNQRLLNTYWTLLLVLMIGDILVGLVWAFRLDQIKSNLRPMLKKKLITLYGKDQKFTDVWNWVQSNDSCCGVDGPSDFLLVNESSLGPLDMNSLANDTWSNYLTLQQERLQSQGQDFIPKLPSTCCIFTVTPWTSSAESSAQRGGWGDRGGGSSIESRRNLQKGRNRGDDHRWNDPARKPILGFYHEEPQQLKGMYYAGNMNREVNVNQEDLFIYNQLKLNDLSSGEKNDNNNNNVSGSSNSSSVGNKLVVSDLRQQPLVTVPYPVVGTAMGYFGTGGAIPPPPIPPLSGAHDRRKIKNKHGYDEYGYIERTRYGGIMRMTTTNSPPPVKPSPATIGVCVLPPHLQNAASSKSSSKPGGSSSHEESSEVTISSTMPPNPTIFTTTQGNTKSSTRDAGSSSTSPPPLSPSSTTSVPMSEEQSHRTHNPFTVSMEQHSEGCGDKVLEWVEHSADVLFVIGFCIIVFLKGCFIAILRYEIKEMIEKIKLLNGENGEHSAAMNELIGMTSTYEASNEDGAEREGLMSDAHNNNQDTSYSNQDTIGGGNNGGGSGSGNGLTVSNTTIRNCEEDDPLGRKDIRQNHSMGNKILGGLGSRQIGNHIGFGTPREKQEIEDDFDSGSALLGDNKHPFGESPPLIDINKHASPHTFFRTEPVATKEVGGGLVTFPKNGNNNNSSNLTSCAAAPPRTTNIDDVRMALANPIILHPNNANVTSTSSH